MIKALPPSHLPNSCDIYEDVQYDEYWKGMDKEKLNRLEHAIVNELLPAHGRRLIDLGCGYGRLADCYLDRFEMLVMLDGSLSLLQAARERTDGKATYIWGDLNRLPFRSAAFDSVLLIRVFHHINDSRNCIEEIQRILCGSGDLVMSYSNKHNVRQMLKFLLGLTQHSPFSEAPNALEPNFIHHHPKHISRLLTDSGFDMSNFRGTGVFDKLAALPAPLSKFIPTGIRLAPMLGKYQLAPWIFFKAVVRGDEPLLSAASAIDLLACPMCYSKLEDLAPGFECVKCRKKYPVRDGILDMRVDS